MDDADAGVWRYEQEKKTIADEIRRKWTKMDSFQFLF